eukprot:3296098-Prymnesium_polylepis.1
MSATMVAYRVCGAERPSRRGERADDTVCDCMVNGCCHVDDVCVCVGARARDILKSVNDSTPEIHTGPLIAYLSAATYTTHQGGALSV